MGSARMTSEEMERILRTEDRLPPGYRIVVRIPAAQVRYRLAQPQSAGGPCPQGRQTFFDLCGVEHAEGLTAEKLQWALGVLAAGTARYPGSGRPLALSTYWFWCNVLRVGAVAEVPAPRDWDDRLRKKAWRAYAAHECAEVLEDFDIQFYEPVYSVAAAGAPGGTRE